MKVKEASSLFHKRVNGTSAVCGLFRKFFSACLLAFVVQAAYAYDIEADGIYYNYLDKDQHTLEVTCKADDDNSYSGNVTIPSSVSVSGVEYSVTSIGESAFWSCTNMLSVEIPEGVTSLGKNCFIGCTGLWDITIPSSVTSLGEGCFRNCLYLLRITIPSSVTSLSNDCFSECQNLTSITIPSSVTSIGDNCFEHCKALKSIVIPESVTSLGEGCFRECTSLTSITIPESVTSLGTLCFYNCTSLASITIPESVTSLGEQCFRSCTNLKDVYILSDEDCYIGNDAFLQAASDVTIHAPYGKKSYYATLSVLVDKTFKECYTISVSKAQYGTFYIDAPFIMPEGLQGGVITDVDGNGVLTIDYRYTAGKTVPAGTGLLLYTDSKDGFSQLVDMEDDGVAAPTDNLLRGSDAEEETTGGDRYYMLSYDAATKSKLGFWWGAENGAAFINSEHKAYLALSGNSEVKGFSLNDLASGISSVSRENGGTEAVKSVYTIDGRRLKAQSTDALPAGIYIVNGKKVAVK